MLKRKRFHPDETYDSMVVTYSSDDAVKVDPVHGNGKFECTLNNPNSITHARKLLPLRAHVPNSYNNVTEGQNTLQFSTSPEQVFDISAASNTSTFKFYYIFKIRVAHGSFLVGQLYRLPAFGWQNVGVTSTHQYNAAGEHHITVPDGTYTLSELSAAIDTAINQQIKSEYDRTGYGDTYWMTEWLQGGPSPVDPTKDSGWKTMPAHAGGPAQRTLQFKNVDGKVRIELHNAFATDLTTNIDIGGLPNVPNASWPERIPHVFGPPFTNPGPWAEWYNDPSFPSAQLDADKYVFDEMEMELTTEQQTLFGFTSSPVNFRKGVTAGIAGYLPDEVDENDATNAVLPVTDPLYSTPITIPPGYYTAAQLADTIDTLLKATTEPDGFKWLHRIRTSYNGDADADLRRCELVNSVFRFYFTPLLTLVPNPSDISTTHTYLDTYSDLASVKTETVSLVGSSSLLRLLGFADDNELQLPTDASMTIYQSVDGGCVNMDIPYVYITSPQISRNNVLTSDSRNRNILAAIPMTGVPRCDYAHYTGVDIYVDNIDYKGPTSLDKVEFEVTDDKHNVLTIPTHTPVAISLKVYHDDTDP